MDARGTEILSLERYIDGKARKADIFERPVAFNPEEITHADDASEALVASLASNLATVTPLIGSTSSILSTSSPQKVTRSKLSA